MDHRLVIYVDGSHQLHEKQTHVLSWGLVALHGDKHHECHGHVTSPRISPIGSHHEQIAFVQAVLYARDLGFDLADVSIFCDDDIFGYAPFFLHPGNYKSERANQVMSRLHCVAKHAFTRDVTPLVVEAFHKSRITKLKGHSEIVYQERVDYLAKHALRSVLYPDVEQELLSMDDWLSKGLVVYEPMNGRHLRTIWRAPFVPEPLPHAQEALCV